ncbi:hypothetical protein ACI6QG_07160 [Roseococcus sp. DSY-14]|uniref:hypothetical protein n=1 Tax=Roseococcus sp. DSY-14 TaxID=3369650 RepID=UPI00387B7DA8
MSPDAALYARLVGAPAPGALPALASAAEALEAAVRDTTDALREADAAMAALRAGRRGAADRLAAALARLDLLLALQDRHTRSLLGRAEAPPG